MKISSYDFGRIVINGREYCNDVIIFRDRVEDNWWRTRGHELSLGDIEKILLQAPEILIIGTGYSGLLKVPEAVVKEINSRGIKLIIKPTKEAVEIYNKLSKKKKNVIAALHLTC